MGVCWVCVCLFGGFLASGLREGKRRRSTHRTPELVAVPLRCELETPPRLPPPLRTVQPDRDKGGILNSTLKGGATLKLVEFSTLTQKPLNKTVLEELIPRSFVAGKKLGL